MTSFFKKYPYWLICIAAVFSSSIYWFLLATDRYVSEAQVVLQSPEVSSHNFSFTSILSGARSSTDLKLLGAYLKSVDMLRKLDEMLDLRAHFSNHNIDLLSRLEYIDAPIEHFHEYYLKRVHINIDEYAGVLIIEAEAFNPEMAHSIATILMQEGEKHMNLMGQRLATEQVKFIENQVEVLDDRLTKARNALLAYQNQHGLISPSSTVESLNTVVAQLDSELALLNTREIALSSFQSSTSPEMISIKSEIDALKKQINIENSRLATTSGDSLNKITAEYETLQLRAKFALELYSNALSALESTRVEAIRKLKQISVLQNPTYPEYSIKPQRIYNTTVFTLLTVLATIIVQLLTAIIKDHGD